MEEKQSPRIPFEKIGEAIKQFGKSAAAAPVLESHWYIVVVGNIDFRQHTPLWYKLIDAINEDEFKSAEATFSVNPPPQMMGFRFDVQDFSLNCGPDRWEISTKNKAKRSRLIDVASIVFKRLWEISIVAYGFHSQLNFPTNKSDVRRFLAEIMSSAGWGFRELTEDAECQYTVKNGAGDHSTAAIANVMGSPLKKSDLVLTYVREYSIGQQTSHYDLGELLRPKAEPGWAEADDFGIDFVKKINDFRKD
jgi:hypothetical protein